MGGLGTWGLYCRIRGSDSRQGKAFLLPKESVLPFSLGGEGMRLTSHWLVHA